MATYLYVIDLDERGQFAAHVQDSEGNVFWEVKYPEYIEDVESGEMVETSTLFEDGYMKDKNDISGLESYLKETGVLGEGDGLTDDEDEMNEEEGSDNKIQELAEENSIPYEVVQKYLSDIGVDADDIRDLNYYGSFNSEADFAESLVDDGVLSTETILYRAEMYDTDKRILAQEQADAYIDDASDDDILEEADMTDEYEESEDNDDKESILDKAKDKVRDDKFDEIYEQLERDAVGYFQDMGYSDEDIVRNSSFTIDYEGLADDLSDSYNFIEHDGDVYVFMNYAMGGYMEDGGDVLTEDSVGRADDIINASDPASYGDGGNLHMLDSTAVELMHHAQELQAVLQDRPDVDAWVIAKAERASTDLSDIVHYLEAKTKMMMAGGDVPAGFHRMPDGTIMPDSAHMAKGGRITKGSRWLQEWKDTDGNKGYDILEIVDTNYFSNKYGGSANTIRYKIFASSKKDRIDKYDEASRNDIKRQIKNNILTKLADGGEMAKGGKAEDGEIVYIEYLNKAKKFAKDKKEFKGKNAYEEAISWGRKNISNFNADMVKFKMADGGDMAKGGKVNRKYTHFAVRKADNKIVAGWDYKGVDKEDIKRYTKKDLSDMDLYPADFSILTKQSLLSEGINPFDWSSWRNPSELHADGGEMDYDPISYAKTKGIESIDWDAELKEYAGDNYNKLSEQEKQSIISDMQRDWRRSHRFDKGGDMAKGGEIPFSNSNLYLNGFGKDSNGNSIIKISFPNGKAFSIQTNGNLEFSHEKRAYKIKDLSESDIYKIEKEVIEYIKEHGSKEQKEKLKTYHSYADGGETKWIQKAVKKEGALRTEAKRRGLLKGEEKLSESDLQKLEKVGGKTGKRARLARTLKKISKSKADKSLAKIQKKKQAGK